MFTHYASEQGFSYIYISTNGAYATAERAKEVIDAGMNSIKFSINAGSRETYKFVHGKDDWDLVINNLKFISGYRKTLARPLFLFVTYVITNQNEHEVDSFRKFISPYVDEVVFFKCGSQSGQMSAAQALLGKPQPPRSKIGICPLPFNRLYVSCEGYLTLCCVDYQNYLAVADLNEMSLRDAWFSEAVKEIRRRHIEQDLFGTLCGNCWLRRRDQIIPLNKKYATLIELEAFYRDVTEKTCKLITQSY